MTSEWKVTMKWEQEPKCCVLQAFRAGRHEGKCIVQMKVTVGEGDEEFALVLAESQAEALIDALILAGKK